MTNFGGSHQGNKWWEKKPGKPRVSWFFVFKKQVSLRPPAWKRVGRPVLVILTALMFAIAGITPTIQEHLRVARAATLTVCSSGCDYTSIFTAVNMSSDGDTISIGTGTFSVTSTLDLAGKAKIFDGAGASNTTFIASSSDSYIFRNTTDAGLATTYTIKEMTITEQSGTAPGILSFNNQTSPVTVNFTDNTVTSFGNTARGLLLVSSGNTSGITATISGNTITMDGTSDLVIDWDGVGTTSTITVASNTVTNGTRFFDYNNGSAIGSTLTVNNNTMSGFGNAGIIITGGTTINVYSNTVTGANTNNGIVVYPDTGGTTSIYSNNLTMGDGTSNNGIDVFVSTTQVTSTQMNIYRNIITGSDIGIDIGGNNSSTGVTSVYNNVLYDLNGTGISVSSEDMTENIFNNTIDNSPAGIGGSDADSGTQLNIINNSLTDTGKSGSFVLACGAANEKIFNNNVYNYTNLNSSCGTYSIGTQGNINVVPGYTNHNTNDFSLSTTSTCSASTDNCDSGMASTTIFHAHVSSAGSTSLVSATDIAQQDQFNGLKLAITAGMGSNQVRDITNTVSSTDTITVSSAWETQPDSTSVFRVYLNITDDYSGNTRPDPERILYDIGAYELVPNTSPTPPSTLYVSSTSAQSGSTNPSNVSSTSPYFSAIANDSDANENLVKARIQVGTSSAFSSNIYWDSQQTTIATTTAGNRISNIQFNNFGAAATTTLSLNDGDITYYWRIKFWDDSSAEGAWSSASSTASFTLVDVPTTTLSVALTDNSDDSQSAILVTWTDNSSTETGFVIQRGANEGAFETVSTTDLGITSYSDTSVSPNVQYVYRIAAQNAAGTSAYTISNPLRTLAKTPTSPSATGDGTSTITVTWSTSNPSGTNYNAENVTAGTNSGWITATSIQFTGLNAGTTYTFRVKARNDDNIETSYTSSFTADTNSQGGSSSGIGLFGPIGAPLVGTDPTQLPKDKPLDKEDLGSFHINNGAKWTNNHDVMLGFNAENVTHLAVADNANMKGASLIPYVASMKWELSKDDGTKILYAQFYNMTRGSKSAVMKSAILLDSTPPGAPQITNAPPYEDISEWLKSGGQLKGTADPEVRIVLLLQRTDLTDKIRKKVKELRALRRKQQGLKTEQKAVKKKVEETQKRTEATKKEVDALLNKVQNLQKQVDALKGEETTAQVERDRLRAEEKEVLNRINALEKEQKALEKEEKKESTKIPISKSGGLKTVEEFFAEVRIAAANKTTHKTESDTKGDWAYTFTPGTFSAHGEYTIAANAEDDGGNKSGTDETSFAALEGDVSKTTEPLPEEEVKEEKKVVTTTPEKTTVKKPVTKETVKKPVTKETVKKPVTKETVKKPVQPVTKPSVTAEEQSTTTVAPSETGTIPSGGEAEVIGGQSVEIDGAGGGMVAVEQPPQTVAEVFVAATETVTQVAQVVAETATIVVQETAKEVAKAAVQTYQVAKAVADNPAVEQVNETVAAPTVAAAAVANVASSATTLPSMLLYLRFLFLQPTMLFGRKKKKAWGIVYNGFTKVPVDLALVRLIIKEKGQVLQSRVTDVAGRYYFLAKQGEYVLEMSKPGFGLISKHLAKVEEDGEFKPLYHGDPIKVEADATPVNPCIPLDPDAKREDVKTAVKKNVWKRVQQGVSGVGFGFSVVSFAVSPAWWMGALLGVHVVSFLFFRRLSKRERKANQFGVIRDKSTNKPIAQAVVRIFDKEYNKLLDTRVTDKDGRYIFLVGRNTYYLLIEAPGYAQYISQPIEMKELGAIATEVALMPGFKASEAPSPELAAALAAGEQKEREAEVRDPSKTRISSDGIPQPSIGFLKNMGVAAETLAKGTFGAETPLVAAP